MKRVRGTKAANDKLRADIKKFGGATMAGLLAGAMIVERQAKKDVPREYGNLVGSGYSRKHQSKPMTAQVGFGAAYALWVHENEEQKLKGKPRPSGLGKYWGPAGKPKYLSGAGEMKRDDVLKVIAAYARRR